MALALGNGLWRAYPVRVVNLHLQSFWLCNGEITFVRIDKLPLKYQISMLS
jgi:hypothetical protein